MNIVGITGQAGSGKDTVADRLVQEHGYVKIALADPIKRLGRVVFDFTDTQLWGPSEMRNAVDKRYDYYCRVRVNGRFDANTKVGVNAGECDPGWFSAAVALQDYAQEWIDEVLPAADVQTLFNWFCALGNNHARLSPRVMLQHLGTEWGRQVADEDIWVNCMLSNAQKVLNGYSYDRRTGVDPTAQGEAPKGVVISDVRFKNELTAIKAAGGKLIRVHRDATDGGALKTGIAGHASEAEQRSFDDKDFDIIIQNNKSLEDLLNFVDVMATTL